MSDFDLGIPVDALATVAQLFKKRTDRGELLVEVGIIPLDRDIVGRGLAGDQVAFALLPVLHMGLRQFAGSVVQQRKLDDVRFHAKHFGRDFREFPGDRLEDLPVRLALVGRVHRRLKRVDERMHVGGVQVVLFVPAGRGQDDVGINAGGGHAEVDGHQQIEFALGRLVMPNGLLRHDAAFLAQVLAHDAVIGAEQVLEEVFMPLARRAEQVRAPDEEVARPVLRGVRVFARHLQDAGFQLFGDIGGNVLAGFLGRL